MPKTFHETKRCCILTALFDIKPVTDQGNLDIERIEKIETILDLKKRKTKQENKQREEAIEIKKPESFLSESPVSIAEDLPLELLTEELPTKEEILAELDEIEAFDNLLKKKQVSLVNESVKEIVPEVPIVPEIPIVPEVARDVPRILDEAVIPLDDFYFPEVASQDYSPAIQFPKQPTTEKSFRSLAPKKTLGLFRFKSFFSFLMAG